MRRCARVEQVVEGARGRVGCEVAVPGHQSGVGWVVVGGVVGEEGGAGLADGGARGGVGHFGDGGDVA